jgi:serine/threonine protein kinase
MSKTDLDRLCMGCMQDRGTAAVCSRCGWDEGAPREPGSQLALPPRAILNGQYLVGRVLGIGGFGITYLAWDLNLARKLAVKEYLPRHLAMRAPGAPTVTPYSGPEAELYEYGMDKFLQEAQVVAGFQPHPGIIAVFNFFRENGTAYLVMEYLDGATLKQHLAERGGRVPFAEGFSLLTPVMKALEDIHRAGVMHRDISPDNIYLIRAGGVKVLDFGAARQALRDRDQQLSVVVKGGYAPPEQYDPAGRQGPWTDVYAVAATLYHAVTGTLPPPSPTRQGGDRLQPPSAMGIAIDAGAERALLKGLAVLVPDRFQSMRELQEALASGVPPDRGKRTWPLPRWALATGGGVAALAVVAWLSWPAPSPAPQPPRSSQRQLPAEPRAGGRSVPPAPAAREPVTPPPAPTPRARPSPRPGGGVPADAGSRVESRLLGTWRASVTNATGKWSFLFTPEAGGTYRTRAQGPFPLPDDTGTIEAREGKWNVRRLNGDVDGGTYTFLDANTVVFQSVRGTLTYRRAN